ncbi:MAG: ABC transporter substrate-binding protein [Rhodospirillales bacterium]|nr:ABC transporter substrate-binding protein [Rhodospirillales bacterium]
MFARRSFLAVSAALVTGFAFSAPAGAAEPIKIGDLNSYTSFTAFSVPYKQGWELALEEINAAGGVLGRPLEVVSRDDGGKPGDAVTVANELVNREGVSVLIGTLLSHVGLAVSDFANQNKILFLAAEPLTDAIAWEKGNPYTFRLRPGTYVQAAMLAEEAAKLPAKRWVTVAPNYEYGQSAVSAFKTLLKDRRPDVEFVAEQWPALGKIDAGATTQALAIAEPEAIFNVTFGGDLVKFVREGSLRGLFEGRAVVSLLTGEPEWMAPLKDEVPEDWIVTGYPWQDLDTPAHRAFASAYEEEFSEPPRMGSVVGYVTLRSIALAMEKAGSTETEALIGAMKGLELDTPFGPIVYRAADQQSTMGTFVGRTTIKDGVGAMKDWRFLDGAKYLPSEEEAAKLRPSEG